MMAEEAEGIRRQADQFQDLVAAGKVTAPAGIPPPTDPGFVVGIYREAYQGGLEAARARAPHATPTQLEKAARTAARDRLYRAMRSGEIYSSIDNAKMTVAELYGSSWDQAHPKARKKKPGKGGGVQK
jgi:hypothetical protein